MAPPVLTLFGPVQDRPGEHERQDGQGLPRVDPASVEGEQRDRHDRGERRAEDACADAGCGHRACWIEEAHVTELTGLLREAVELDRAVLAV